MQYAVVNIRTKIHQNLIINGEGIPTLLKIIDVVMMIDSKVNFQNTAEYLMFNTLYLSK